MKLTNEAKLLLDLINNSGYEAYAVGGFVRDAIMNREAGDIDIASSALPSELEAILDDNGIKYIETGLKHGTITAIINHIPYEITTFRTDGEYNDNRHPDNVQFVRNIKEDLARRDFTINAIAYNDINGIVDIFGGIEDIKNKTIRCVGDPDKRFREDALRIIRCLRFSSVLGYKIEEKTKEAIFNNKALLKNIAIERVFIELNKLLVGDYVEDVLLEYREVFAVIIPELSDTFDFDQNTKWHIYDIYTHIVKSVSLSPKKDYIRMAVLLHDIGKPHCLRVDERGIYHFFGHEIVSAEIAYKVLKRFKASNDYINKVVTLIRKHNDYITNDSADIKHWLNELGIELTLDYIDVKIADLSSHNLDLSQHEIDTINNTRYSIENIIDSGEPFSISQLDINGNDIKNLGYNGREIAECLNYLLEIVIDNPKMNTKENLIKKIKERN